LPVVDLAADARLRDVKFRRGARNILLLRHGDEVTEMAQFYRATITNSYNESRIMICLKFANRAHCFLITKIREPWIEIKTSKSNRQNKMPNNLDGEQLLLDPLNWRYATNGLDKTARNAWARNQAYIASGNPVNSAALLGIDLCPMEGFDRAQYDETLGLMAQGLASAVIATLGYRLPRDKCADAAKLRFPNEEALVALISFSQTNQLAKAFNHLPAARLGTNPLLKLKGQRPAVFVSSNDADGEPGGLLFQNVEKLIGEAYE
jgi:hypothetical protein